MLKKNKRIVPMLAIFPLFIFIYYLTYSQYSKIIGLLYTAFITFQILVSDIYSGSKYKKKLKWLSTVTLDLTMILSLVYSQIDVGSKLFLFLLCSSMIFISGLCSHIPYNPFIGIRIFSTRNDAANWEATHKVLANLSIPISCLLLILSNFFDMQTAIVISFSIWLILPIIYSIWFYPSKRKYVK